MDCSCQGPEKSWRLTSWRKCHRIQLRPREVVTLRAPSAWLNGAHYRDRAIRARSEYILDASLDIRRWYSDAGGALRAELGARRSAMLDGRRIRALFSIWVVLISPRRFVTFYSDTSNGELRTIGQSKTGNSQPALDSSQSERLQFRDDDVIMHLGRGPPLGTNNSRLIFKGRSTFRLPTVTMLDLRLPPKEDQSWKSWNQTHDVY